MESGRQNQGAVLKQCISFERAKECLRRTMASWVDRCANLSPMVFRALHLSASVLEMEETSPMGGPKRVASWGSTTRAPGIESSKGSIVSLLQELQIISDFTSFNSRQISAPTLTTSSKSCLRSSVLPPWVPSSR